MQSMRLACTIACAASCPMGFPCLCSPTSQFVKTTASADGGGDKVQYATMMFTRGAMVKQTGGMLARAVTIAARYSAVRRQGYANPSSTVSYKDPELPILDHRMQLYVGPLLPNARVPRLIDAIRSLSPTFCLSPPALLLLASDHAALPALTKDTAWPSS